MPHCLQKNDPQEEHKHDNNNEKHKIIKQKALTTEQSNQARMCTKIRSMVEKIFGVLKQNYRSLDYVRNSVIGHLGIDLKNCCAFHNFKHKPLLYDSKNFNNQKKLRNNDEENSAEVAKRLRYRAENFKANHLDFLLKLRLASTRNLKRIVLGEIDDFVLCNGNYLRRKVFLGSFQYRMAKKSYVTDLVKKSKIYLVTPNKKKFDPSTKIIAAKMPSRFVRGKNKKKIDFEEIDQYTTFRRVFVQYTPNSAHLDRKGRKCDQINGYICSCKNGKRTAGCCSHVACLIYYLSCARQKPFIKHTNEYLNRIFLNKYKNIPK
jgi:hypothetical protein